MWSLCVYGWNIFGLLDDIINGLGLSREENVCIINLKTRRKIGNTKHSFFMCGIALGFWMICKLDEFLDEIT